MQCGGVVRKKAGWRSNNVRQTEIPKLNREPTPVLTQDAQRTAGACPTTPPHDPRASSWRSGHITRSKLRNWAGLSAALCRDLVRRWTVVACWMMRRRGPRASSWRCGWAAAVLRRRPSGHSKVCRPGALLSTPLATSLQIAHVQCDATRVKITPCGCAALGSASNNVRARI